MDRELDRWYNIEEAEKWRKWNENQVQKQMQTDKLEELAIAGKDNQIEI